MGVLGGSSSSGTAAATSAIEQGTTQGLQAIQQYYAQAVPALTAGYGSAQADLGGYGVAGSTALDSYYNMLGLPVPTIGTEALTQALQFANSYQAPSANSSATGGQAIINSLSPATGINFLPGQYEADQTAQSKQPGGYMFNQTTGNLYTSEPGTGTAATSNEASLGLQSVQNPTTGLYSLQAVNSTPSTPLTAAQQQQLTEAGQYQNGTLSMTTANPSTILASLQATPGYQFLQQQGLQGVDRSAAAQGLLGSGAAIQGAENFSTGLAEQTYNTQLGALASAAGLGQQTATEQASLSAGLGTGLANAALGTGSNVASLYGSQAAGLAQVGAGQAAASGTAASGAASGLGSLAGGVLSLFSDRRLKTDIEPVGIHPNGLPIYSFKYTFDPDTVQYGHMADEVLELYPECVEVDNSGFYKVNYAETNMKRAN